MDMVCLYCGGDTAVINSRLQKRQNYIWRRRKCLACASIITTIERPELTGALVVRKPSGQQAALNRDHLFLAIYESCKHRPTAIADATALTDTVLPQIIGHQRGATIESGRIAQLTHLALQRFDPSAAAVYAAYHPHAATS